ncbi:MAG: glycosyltransferase [Planctomycetota bacterium]|nr:glycosyltransferase [Planctomycetota bacterium]
MPTPPRVVLVAKPWRGGLAHYVFSALKEKFAGDVGWWPTYPDCWREHIAYLRDKSGWRDRLLDRINAADCEHVLFINAFGPPGALKHPERNILWMTDSAQLEPEAAKSYSKIFLSDPGYRSDLAQRIGDDRVTGVLPFAFDPQIHSPAQPQPARYDVCFIGNRDVKRDTYLPSLFDANFRSLIVGNYWLKHPLAWRHPLSFQKSVSREGMGTIYARSKVSLNLHANVVREGTNMRTFECAGYGIAQLVEERPGLDKLFVPEREIITFRTADEMIEQARRLLNDSGLRQKLGENARRRAVAEHTYRHRLETIFRD